MTKKPEKGRTYPWGGRIWTDDDGVTYYENVGVTAIGTVYNPGSGDSP